MAGDLKPRLVVYRELLAGDIRKLLAQSNISKSGGGARDLRLPYRAFRDVMARMLPNTRTRTSHGGWTTTILSGPVVHAVNGGDLVPHNLEYWSPTEARPSEGRIARVHGSPALGGDLPKEGKGRVLVVLIRWSDERTSIHYAYEDELNDPTKWAAEIRTPVLGCMATSLFAGKPAMGYVDLAEGTHYCHADPA